MEQLSSLEIEIVTGGLVGTGPVSPILDPSVLEAWLRSVNNQQNSPPVPPLI